MKKAIFKLLPAASIFFLASCGAHKVGAAPTEPRICEPDAVYRITLPNAAELTEPHTFQAQYAWHINNATNLVINPTSAP